MKKKILMMAAAVVAGTAFAGNPGTAEAPKCCASAMNTLWGLPTLWWLTPVAALLALLMAAHFYRRMTAAPEGNPRMVEIAGFVREGAMAYLRRQYRVVGVVFLVLLAIFLVLAFFGIQNPFVPVAFLTGGFFSGLCGYIGMRTATRASSRTAQGASEGISEPGRRLGNEQKIFAKPSAPEQ